MKFNWLGIDEERKYNFIINEGLFDSLFKLHLEKNLASFIRNVWQHFRKSLGQNSVLPYLGKFYHFGEILGCCRYLKKLLTYLVYMHFQVFNKCYFSQTK